MSELRSFGRSPLSPSSSSSAWPPARLVGTAVGQAGNSDRSVDRGREAVTDELSVVVVVSAIH